MTVQQFGRFIIDGAASLETTNLHSLFALKYTNNFQWTRTETASNK